MSIRDFGKIATDLSRNPLGMIGLFITLVYGLAVIVTSSNNLDITLKMPLIYFLVIFPFIILGVFYRLVALHSNKLFMYSTFSLHPLNILDSLFLLQQNN